MQIGEKRMDWLREAYPLAESGEKVMLCLSQSQRRGMVIKMNKYNWLDDYLQAKKGCAKDYKLEWGWWRYQVGGKLFAATCQPGPEHQGYDCRELLTLKCEPMLAEALRAEYPDIIPGFYTDKRNWISVFLDGAVPDDVLRGLCNRSYELVFSKLTKKMQREIAEQAQ